MSSNHPCCRVLIVDDHSIMREGLKRLMPEAFEVVAEAATAREAFRVLEDRSLVIDVAVVDYGLPDFNGVDTAIKLLELRPSLKVMMLSAYDDSDIVADAIRANVRAFVKKSESPAVLIEALRAIASGGSYLSATATDKIMERVRQHSDGDLYHARALKKLSPRELQVVRLIAQGKQTKEIATLLTLSEQTVKTHRKNVMKRLGATNTAQLMTIAAKQRIIYLSGDWRD